LTDSEKCARLPYTKNNCILDINSDRILIMRTLESIIKQGDCLEVLQQYPDNYFDVIMFNSQVGSGFGKNIANWVGRDKAYPSNVLHLATETGNRNHSATFPRDLPEWFLTKSDWTKGQS